jgi:predicted RNA-binding protein with PIN domain
MPVIIDGNNVLGAARLAAAAKRQLVRDLARYARAKRTKVICVFDGVEPEHFGKQLGAVSVVFSGARTADELIAKRAATGTGWKVVTADRGLAARVGGRRVEVVDPRRFVAEIEALPAGEDAAVTDDWISYFSDPKNRNVF